MSKGDINWRLLDKPELQEARAHVVEIVFEDFLFLFGLLGGFGRLDCDCRGASTLRYTLRYVLRYALGYTLG